MSTNDTPDTILIPLTQDQFAVIDAIDSDLAKFKWSARFDPTYGDNGRYIARRHAPSNNKKRPTILLHRTILARVIGRDLQPFEQTDHIDHNTLNNRRENLRLATRFQNSMNKALRKDNKSGYKGVSWSSSRKKWQAQIASNGDRYHLGFFETAEEAYFAYCESALRLHGEFARLE